MGIDWFVLVLPFSLVLSLSLIGVPPFVKLMRVASPVPKRGLWLGIGIGGFLWGIVGCLCIGWYLLGSFALDAWQGREMDRLNQVCSVQWIVATHNQTLADRAWLFVLGLMVLSLGMLLCNLARQQARNQLVRLQYGTIRNPAPE
jgi:hypothetical protein